MFIASALNVVDITLMPAMPGTITSRLSWLPPKIAPNRARNSSGRKKLKNAADGLRQNIRRSSRYWCQARTAASVTGGCAPRGSGGQGGRGASAPGGSPLGLGPRRVLRRLGRQLEVDVLEGRPRDRQ